MIKCKEHNIHNDHRYFHIVFTLWVRHMQFFGNMSKFWIGFEARFLLDKCKRDKISFPLCEMQLYKPQFLLTEKLVSS